MSNPIKWDIDMNEPITMNISGWRMDKIGHRLSDMVIPEKAEFSEYSNRAKKSWQIQNKNLIIDTAYIISLNHIRGAIEFG